MNDGDTRGRAHSRSILMMSTEFSLDDGSSGLLRDLCDALVATGNQVTVCFMDWKQIHGSKSQITRLSNGVEVLIIPPWRVTGLGSFIANASKWGFSSLFAIREFSRHFQGKSFDLIIAFSPLVVMGWLIISAKRRFRCQTYAYLTDFFPFHQRGAGQDIGGGLAFRIGLALETYLIRQFEHIACMSQAGITFVKQRYALVPTQQVHLLRLWGNVTIPQAADRSETRQKHGLPTDRPIVLFGGQISEGRGIEEILEVASLFRSAGQDAAFVFMGGGRLEPLVREHIAAGAGNVILKSPVDREDYLSVIAACDVGLVATVPGTGVPSFPSKTIDYLRAGIAVVASVEDTTDYSAFVQEAGFGVAVPAGNPHALFDAISAMLKDPDGRREMARRGRQALVDHFDVNQAARAILTQTGTDPSPRGGDAS